MTIGERISKCRKEKNLSQEYVAEMLEISRQAVSKWENDLTEPDTGNLIKLARLFGVSVEYLASGEEAQPRIEYIERGVPLSKTIAVVLISLGGLSALLGILLSWILIGVAILLITYGVLMLTVKREGTVVGAAVVTMAVVLFIIQGLTGEFDLTSVFIILAVSILVPITVWGAVKLIKLARSGQLHKLSEITSKMTKKQIIITIVVILVVLVLILGICLGLSAKKKAAIRASWFDEDYLAKCNLSGMPAFGGDSRIKLSSREVILNFKDDADYEMCAYAIYNYLTSKHFMHLGTRGAVLNSFGENITYELVDCKKLNDFKVKTSENNSDYIFVYTKDRGDASGEVACHVIYLDKVVESEMVVNGERMPYNAVLSIYSESFKEAYKIRALMTHNITYEGDGSIYYGTQPITAISDWAVVISTVPFADGDINLYANGVPIKKTAIKDDRWEYKFTMPREDVVITAEIVSKPPAASPSLGLVLLEPWLADLTAADIREVKFAHKNGADLTDSPFVSINTTADKEIIEEYLRQYKVLAIEPVEISQVPLDGGGWSRATFVLNDGTVHTVSFAAGYYEKSDGEYYSIAIIPTLMPYDYQKITCSVSLALWKESHTAYYADGSELGEVSGICDLEFWSYEGDVNYKTKDCLYYIETELGTVYICSDTVFMFLGDSHEPQAYELLSGSFYELMDIDEK